MTFSFQGKVESQPFGLYTQSFERPDGTTATILSTKCEATDARRSVNGTLATTVFERSPKMPIYLVELSAGDFSAVSTSIGKTGLGSGRCTV